MANFLAQSLMEMETGCHWQSNLASQIWWDSGKMLIFTQKLPNIQTSNFSTNQSMQNYMMPENFDNNQTSLFPTTFMQQSKWCKYTQNLKSAIVQMTEADDWIFIFPENSVLTDCLCKVDLPLIFWKSCWPRYAHYAVNMHSQHVLCDKTSK